MRPNRTCATVWGLFTLLTLGASAEASPLLYSVSVSGSGTATYSTSSNDPAFQPSSGSGSATFSASGENVFDTMTDVSISVDGTPFAVGSAGDNFNGSATVSGIGASGIGTIHIEAFNGNVGFGGSSTFGEVTLKPTKILTAVVDGNLVYTIAAGTGSGDARSIVEEPATDDQGNDLGFYSYETDVLIDITSFTGTVYVYPVPLPSAAPLFGGALLMIGIVGCRAKRGMVAQA